MNTELGSRLLAARVRLRCHAVVQAYRLFPFTASERDQLAEAIADLTNMPPYDEQDFIQALLVCTGPLTTFISLPGARAGEAFALPRRAKGVGEREGWEAVCGSMRLCLSTAVCVMLSLLGDRP